MSRDRASQRTLSKSDFTLALECDAKLWFRENGYPDARAADRYLHLLAEGTFMVEALARAAHPDGILLEFGHDHIADYQQTRELLARDRVTIFQATVLSRRRLSRIHIIDKQDNIVRLLDVKAKAFDSAAHLASLASGGFGVFRERRGPYDVRAEWRSKLEDVTFQTLLLERVMPGVCVRPYLVLVDRSKRATIDGLPQLFEFVRRTAPDGTPRAHSARFTGTAEQLAAIDLLTTVDVSAEVQLLRDNVESAATRYEAMLDSPFDERFPRHSADCKRCGFNVGGDETRNGFARCWGPLANVAPHVLELYNAGATKIDGAPLVETLVASGTASLFDVPEHKLVKRDGKVGPVAERQLRQIQCARTGEAWVGPYLRSNIEALVYPLHFVDFEVSRLALPYHAHMRPYGQVVFQWSCHTVAAPGAAPTHQEWLNTEDLWPNKAFAIALRNAIDGPGTVITWSAFERSRLEEIVAELPKFGEFDPALVTWIEDTIVHRIVDMHDWAKRDYYHPLMRGRTSIKVVLDALWRSDSTMREQYTAWSGQKASATEDPYHALQPIVINDVAHDVREGTGAVRAYEAMMYGVEKNDQAAKRAWQQLLLQYCKLDTLSMVLVFEHWRRATGVASIPSYSPLAEHARRRDVAR
jgi:uncharacterized protein DUF2779